MSTLFGTMSIAMSGLAAQQAGLETTTDNISNINTAGYTRERPVLEEADSVLQNGVAYGTGVNVTGIESLRDNILELQIGAETQQQGKSQALVNAMGEVQSLFPDASSGIGQQISAIFQSLNNLSTNPSDTTLRESVLSAADAMARSFNNTSNQLVSMRSGLDQNVQSTVSDINQITQQIAAINQSLEASTTTGQNGSLLDQRSSLIQKLSGLTDVSVLNQGSSLTLTTSQGTPLVAATQSFALTTALDPSSGMQHIYSQMGDITSKISGGQLGGMLEARDQTIPTVQSQLDSLASGLSQALNTAHQQGFDLNGDPGGDLFKPVAGAGAAANMAVAITNPDLLAASSDGTTGSNGNIANLSAVANQVVANGMTPTQCYGNVVFTVGNAANDANAELQASKITLQQLQQQDAAVSGISLDQEASNLLLYQRAYQAAAQAVSAVDQMLQVALRIGNGA